MGMISNYLMTKDEASLNLLAQSWGASKSLMKAIAEERYSRPKKTARRTQLSKEKSSASLVSSSALRTLFPKEEPLNRLSLEQLERLVECDLKKGNRTRVEQRIAYLRSDDNGNEILRNQRTSAENYFDSPDDEEWDRNIPWCPDPQVAAVRAVPSTRLCCERCQGCLSWGDLDVSCLNCGHVIPLTLPADLAQENENAILAAPCVLEEDVEMLDESEETCDEVTSVLDDTETDDVLDEDSPASKLYDFFRSYQHRWLRNLMIEATMSGAFRGRVDEVWNVAADLMSHGGQVRRKTHQYEVVRFLATADLRDFLPESGCAPVQRLLDEYRTNVRQSLKKFKNESAGLRILSAKYELPESTLKALAA